MLSWLAKQVLSRKLARLREGDPGPLLAMDAGDVGTDRLTSPQGGIVYENRYVIWGRIAWGLVREYEVYEDTQRTEALDRYLAEAGKL